MEGPSIPFMLNGLAVTFEQVLEQFKRNGIIITEEQKREQRKAVCKDCSSYNSNLHRCNECGCMVDVKIYVDASRCPLGKW